MADLEDELSKGKTFKDLKLNDWIVNHCDNVGIKQPTPIQYSCIPPILGGHDCIGCAETGSGKTMAFALPIVQKWCEDPYGIFALVLTPTRELAFQISEQFSILGRSVGLRVSVIVGGMDMVKQGKELSQRPHIVIATPGRLVDHLDSCNTFTLQKIKFLVLDEADRLLEGHFDDQLKSLFSAVPKNRQTLLFSATITDTLKKLQEIAMNKPFVWISKGGVPTVEQLDQQYVLCPKDVKDGYLVHILLKYREENPKGSVMIFTSTCRSCQVLSITLNELGLDNVPLHSMISQKQRLASLAKFKSNLVKVLIATDVASRGLDIPAVQVVMNYNVPSVPKDYIHRVGRTARAGRQGTALTLVTQHDIHLLHAVEDLTKTCLVERKVNDKDVLKILTQVAVTKREAEIKLDENDFDEKRNINRRKKLILAGKDPDEEEGKSRKRRKAMKTRERKIT